MRTWIITGLIISSFLFASVETEAKNGRSRGEGRNAQPKGPIHIFTSTLALVPSLTGSVLVGEAADSMDGMKNSISAGLGLALEYYYRPAIAFGVRLENEATRLYSQPFSKPWIEARSIAVYALYLFTPRSRTSFYLRGQVGNSKFDVIDFKEDELGSHPYLRVSVGQTGPKSSRRFTRFEFYYKRLFIDPEEILKPSYAKIKYDVSSIGLELAFGFGL